jgi:hypothetical protein
VLSATATAGMVAILEVLSVGICSTLRLPAIEKAGAPLSA